MPDNLDWKSAEEIAALLEKTLTPSAQVEHDVRLPVIGRNRRRQCDVVITYGSHPRQTIAIVEVQKRKRRPNITTFHGWIQKMREVGAQHLICVSALGYPKSIIEEVLTVYGPTVRLLTLQQLAEPSIGDLVAVSPFLIHRKPILSFESVESPPEIPQGLEGKVRMQQAAFKPIDKIFSLGESEIRYSLMELTNQIVKHRAQFFHLQQQPEPVSYPLNIELGSDDQNLWLHQGSERFPIYRFRVRIRVTHQITEIPMTFHAYRQEFLDGVLAWIVSANGTVESEQNISVKLIFHPDQQGLLRLVNAYHDGGEQLSLYVYSDKDDAIRSYRVSSGTNDSE